MSFISGEMKDPSAKTEVYSGIVFRLPAQI